MANVLITDNLHECCEQIIGAAGHTVDVRAGISHAALVEIVGKYDALVTRSQTAVDADVIAAGKKLAVICRAAIGVDNIDVDTASEHGILIVNCPYDNVVSAAEHTMALLLACCRNLVAAHQSLKSAQWDRKSYMGIELNGKKLGIVGLGKVGSRVARMAHGFGMEVVAYDPYITDEKFSESQARKMETLDALIRECDVLTVHTPKTAETTGMIGERELGFLHDRALVVNCARGGIVDEDALLRALENGRVAGAGIDVWENEPAVDRPLQKHPNVVMTPHLGANTGEAQFRIARTSGQQVVKALANQTVDHPVNMPNIKATHVDRIANYVVLAEKLGLFGEQYSKGRVRQIEIIFQGELAGKSTDLLTMALLKEFVAHTTEERITYVNARRKIDDLGIKVRETRDPLSSSFKSALTAVFRAEDDLTLRGTVFDERYPHIVQVNRYYFDIIPEGTFILIRNEDKPGVIGEVGTILGEEKINIARWELGRMKEGTTAMAAIQVDQSVDERVLRRIRGARHVIEVEVIRL